MIRGSEFRGMRLFFLKYTKFLWKGACAAMLVDNMYYGVLYLLTTVMYCIQYTGYFSELTVQTCTIL